MQEEYCTLDPITRKLTLTEPQRIAGVESDENARGLKFKFPKTVDNIDLTQMQVRINFMNSRGEKDQYIVTDLKPTEGEEGYITFTWPFSRLVTKYRGLTKFIVCAIKTDLDGTVTTEWNTALAQLRVLEGLEVDESDITPEEKDIIAQLIAICETAVAESAASAQRAQAAAEQAAQGAQKSEAAATEADVSAQEAETSAVNSAASAQQAQTAAEQAAQEAQQSETSATESAASAQQAKEEADKVFKYGPAIGPDGNWLIGGVNTGKPSRGITPDFQIGTVTTLPPSSEATANITGEPENPKLNLGIPKGENGAGAETKPWRLIADVNVTEDVQIVDITKDMDNLAFRLSEVYILAEAVTTETAENRAPNMNTLFNGVSGATSGWITVANNAVIPSHKSNKFFYYAYVKFIPNIASLCWHQASPFTYNQKTSMEQQLVSYSARPETATSIRIRNDTKDKVLFSSGTRIRIWGLDA